MLPPVFERFWPLYSFSLNDDLNLQIKDNIERCGLYQLRKSESVPTPLVVFCLAESKGNVAVFDHMLDLSPHYRQSSVKLAHKLDGGVLTCQTEEDDEINYKHWPKHRHIEHAPPSAEEGNRNRPCAAVPKLELWQPSYERAKLFVLFCG